MIPKRKYPVIHNKLFSWHLSTGDKIFNLNCSSAPGFRGEVKIFGKWKSAIKIAIARKRNEINKSFLLGSPLLPPPHYGVSAWKKFARRHFEYYYFCHILWTEWNRRFWSLPQWEGLYQISTFCGSKTWAKYENDIPIKIIAHFYRELSGDRNYFIRFSRFILRCLFLTFFG